MFRKLARDLKFEPRIGPALPPGVSDVNSIVFLYHPIQLAAFLEAAWAERFQTDARRSPVPEMPGGQGGTRPGFEGNFLETLLALAAVDANVVGMCHRDRPLHRPPGIEDPYPYFFATKLQALSKGEADLLPS
jgi:hypothetical protein